jgi:hypothetical protein
VTILPSPLLPATELEAEVSRLASESSRLSTRSEELTQANIDTEKSAANMVKDLGDRVKEEVRALWPVLDFIVPRSLSFPFFTGGNSFACVQLNLMLKEMEHKFSMQSAENKRLRENVRCTRDLSLNYIPHTYATSSRHCRTVLP